jgi:hypothetical protein
MLNIVLTSGLAAGGVLKSVQQDTNEYYVQEGGGYTAELPEDTDRPFVGELITDADAYYNAVIRAENNIQIYPPSEVFNQYTQRYHYAPAVIFPFVLLALFGYAPFKLLLLGTSIAAVVVGSYAILRAETTAREFDISNRILIALAVATVGFGPMVSNYKVGQISPFIYLAVAGCWYWYRQGKQIRAGAALTVAALTKPYFLAPAAILISRKHFIGVVGVIGGTFAGYGFSVAVFGADTLINYFGYVKQAVLSSESSGVPSVAEWGVESVYPLFSLGPISTTGRVLIAVGFGLLWVQYLRNGSPNNTGSGVFAGSLVMIMVVIQQASNMDLAVCLAAYLVLGPELYSHDRGFELLGLSFLLTTIHPYAMEVIAGGGHVNLISLTDGTLQTLLQFLQPAVYGLYILMGLSVFVVLQHTLESRDIYSGNPGIWNK